MTAAVVTLAFLPIYLLMRHPFRRIPLHIDTGFYVSNNTIATGRLSLSKGWNAQYAGCSKVFPELFYSAVYLLHGRGTDAPGERYKSMSRVWASGFNYVTAIAVGILTLKLTSGGTAYYYAGLVTFALLSSEPHYGIYHECGEIFQLLTDVVSVLSLVHGLHSGNPILVAGAACLWLLGAFYIKLSAGLGFPILFGAVALRAPSSAVPMGIGPGIALASYIAWARWNGRSIASLLAPLVGHERAFSRSGYLSGLRHRIVEKARTAATAVRNQPLLPLLAVIGCAVAPPSSAVFWLYVAAVVAVYGAQATDCRYYLIPLLPAIAVLAACGIVAIAEWGAMGGAILATLAALWIWHNSWRAAQMDGRSLNSWSWKSADSPHAIERNLQLESACEAIRPLVGADAILVYGPCNQAYVLIGASYPTAIVSPEYYLDDVCPGWQRSLNAQLVEHPPKWVLDTGRCFDAQEGRRLGLDYRMTQAFAGDFRLYHLVEVHTPCADYEAARTFGPQSAARLEREGRFAGDSEVRFSCPPTDRAAVALKNRLQELATAGKRRIAIYGAGRFTIRHADIYRESDATIVCVIDDNPGPAGANFLDWSVRSPDDVDPSAIDAIIVSTDRFTAPIVARIRRRWGDQISAYTVDSSEPRASARADARV